MHSDMDTKGNTNLELHIGRGRGKRERKKKFGETYTVDKIEGLCVYVCRNQSDAFFIHSHYSVVGIDLI